MIAPDERQTFLVHLSPRLSRRVRTLIDQPSSAYSDISELVAVALENHLSLSQGEIETFVTYGAAEERSALKAPGAPAAPADLGPLVRRPGVVDLPTIVPARAGHELFVLTNRLNPMALAVRVLVNMTVDTGPPTLDEFTRHAGACARELGIRLRDEDRRRDLRGAQKRSTAWPIGADSAKSLDRFRWSFLLWRPAEEKGPGPLAELGLAGLDEGVVRPSARGVELAAAPSAILGEAVGWTLSTEQQAIFRDSVLETPNESDEVAYLLESVERHGGKQGAVEQQVAHRHPAWSLNRIIAHRAALLGRIRDLGLVDVVGVGGDARISITTQGVAFMNHVAERATETALMSGGN